MSAIATSTPRRRGPLETRTFPIIEVFGPTIQGEGAEAGVPTHFVRLGGCDYRCSWCDTMYAVDPDTIRKSATRLSGLEVIEAVGRLAGAPRWVTISGGNPALFPLDALVDGFHEAGLRVAVETQGSLWRPWLASVDRLTVSPKPPSSGMATTSRIRRFNDFMPQAVERARDRMVLKIVCFDDADLAWAKATAAAWPSLPLFLSAGTPVPSPGPVREAVGDRYAWLCEAVAADPDLADVRVIPQLHVIAWKEATGV